MAKRKKESITITAEERLKEALVPENKQPYQLPRNWCWVSIKTINQYLGTSLNPGDFPDTEFELYSVPSSANNYPEIITGDEIGSSKQIVQEGDVLLCKINPRINRVWIVSRYTKFDLLASSEWIVVRNKIINAKYIMWYFRSPSFREYMMSNVSGVGGSLMRAKPKLVEMYPVPVPPIAEQQRIVDRIENLFSKLDEAEEKLQSVLDSFETRKAAILHKAFMGELSAKWREENGVLFQSWKVCKIKNITQIGSGGTPSRNHSSYYSGDIPWVKTGEINWNYIFDSEEKITEEAIRNSSARMYPPDTVLVAMYGQGLTRGRASILGIAASTNQAVCALQVSNSLMSKFLYYFFMANYWTLRERAVGGTQLNYSATMIGKWEINLPTIPEQEEIVRIIDNFISKEEQAKELIEAEYKRISVIRNSILSKAFHGEFGTNNPNDEDAKELVKKILG